MRREAGNATIFVVVCILPFLFLLLSLCIDIAVYLKDLRNTNEVLDEAALFAYRYMPDRQATLKALKSYLKTNAGRISADIMADFDGDSLVLSYSAQSSLPFASFFKLKSLLPLNITSKVRSTNYDIMVLMDVGSYLYPTEQEKVWEQVLTSSDPSPWYPAQLFLGDSSNRNKIEALRLTQRCFNPAFNPIKATAIGTINHFLKEKLNAVGALVYPASTIQNSIIVNPVVRKGSFSPSWSGFADFQIYCVSIAEDEKFEDRYKFPFLEHRDVGSRVIKDLNKIYYSDYQPDLAEVLWTYPVQDTVADFTKVLSVAKSQIVASELVPERAGLTGLAQKSIIVFSGDVPWVGGSRYPTGNSRTTLLSEIQKLREDVEKYKLRLKVYYILWKHVGLNRFQDLDINTLRSDFESMSADTPNSKLDLRVVYAESYDDFINSRLLDGIFLDQKNVVLSK